MTHETRETIGENAAVCLGASVDVAWHDMAECRACGSRVRWDLQDDQFFGFAAWCPVVKHRRQAREGEAR